MHLLIRERTAEVQIRVKGDLKTAKGISLHADQAERLARAMYTGLATVKEATYNPLSFQDAQIAGYVLPRSGLTSVRIIRGPSWPAESGGGFLVARLQYEGTRREIDPCVARAAAKRLKLATPERPSGEFHLGRMGFTPLQVALIERIMRNPQGIFFVTGPTGSGKTTTLYEIMMELARQYPEQRLITIENPVEYPIQGSLQLSTESERFGEMLRMALRMDPDTILPSEIRGVEEAIAAFQAAQTGHRVPTTLHVNDPYEVFARLAGLDHVRLAPAMIAHHRLIIGLMAQRRVPILCPHCSVPLAQSGRRLPAYLLSALRTWGDLATVRARGDGCEHCDGSNIAHEQAIAEVVVTDEVLMHAVREGDVLRAARKHRAKPGADKPMIEHAIDLVFAGRLDPDDAEQKVEPIPVKELQ
ncbi:type II secretion system protein E [Caballeronia calidae]|uniref:Type II secretion system protein E n=1 Tax=Caballeronia calidae TaxID=1777139 RepID=A0A158EFR5_9BURK|nr:type II secretion system protein E [Caballeronia calidae]